MRAGDIELLVGEANSLNAVLLDYGLKDAAALRYVLDQYQTVIHESTHGRLSKLTYPASKVLEEMQQHGYWMTDSSSVDSGFATCSVCHCEFLYRRSNSGRR